VESDEVREVLGARDRSRVMRWTDYPPTPRWYPVAFGVWAAALTVAFTVLDDTDLKVPAVLALIAVEIGFLRWYVRYRGGAMPTGAAPRELRGPIALFVAAAVAVLVGVAALTAWVSPWAAAVFALVASAAAVAWYERAYAVAAGRARDRLA
jgi:hypothetical protein